MQLAERERREERKKISIREGITFFFIKVALMSSILNNFGNYRKKKSFRRRKT